MPLLKCAACGEENDPLESLGKCGRCGKDLPQGWCEVRPADVPPPQGRTEGQVRAVKFAYFALLGVAAFQVLSCWAVFVIPLRLEIISGAVVMLGFGLTSLAFGALARLARFHPLLALGGGLLLDGSIFLLDFLGEEGVPPLTLMVRASVAAVLTVAAGAVGWTNAQARRRRKIQRRDHNTPENVHGREDQHPDADEAAHRRQGGSGGDGAYRAGTP